MRLVIVLSLTALCLSAKVEAQTSTQTIIFGEAQNPNGTENATLLLQPAESPNPLGNPIPTAVSSPNTDTAVVPSNTAKIKMSLQPQNDISQAVQQDPPPFSETPQQESTQIQNTLYEGGNRIYDVQSYPLSDIKTITEPNINPTITTYPEY